MRATIQKLNMSLPYCDARTDHDILFVFRPPASGLLHVGDAIELDPRILGAPQTALHVPSGERFSIEIHSNDVHDLRLPAAHGASRFPSPERLYDNA
jgi:hypothetical protein